MKNRKLLSILGVMFMLSSAGSCRGADNPGNGDSPSNRVTTPGEPISVVDGKVRFYIDVDAEASRLKAGVTSAVILENASAVYVNGTKYELTTDTDGNLYADVLENAQGSYSASLAFKDGSDWFGTSPTIDLAIPAGQFFSSAAFDKFPMYADYSESNGNKLMM